MKLVIVFLFTWALSAQTIDLRRTRCTGDITKARILAILPVSPTTVSPVCLELPDNAKVVQSATGPKLEIAFPLPNLIPKVRLERVVIPTTISASQTTFPYTLTKTPAPDTPIFVLFRSSISFADAMDAMASTLTRNLVISLPDYRPFTSADVVTLVYWTLE